MAEYIDLDTPLEVKVARGSTFEPYTSTLRELLDVNHIPYTAADVRPVALCRDCKYWKQWDNTTHYLCTYVAGAKFIRDADDFCSRGEKE